MPHFVHPFTSDGHVGCFHLLAIVNQAALNNYGEVFAWPYVFISLGCTIPGSGIAGPWGSFMLQLLRICKNVLHRGCPVLHSH